MIPDQLLKLADNYQLTGSTDSNRVTDVIDIDTLRDLGTGTTLFVRFEINESIRSTTASGTNFYLAYADNSGLGGAVYLTNFTTNQTSSTGPTASQVFYIPIPPATFGALGTLSASYSIPNNTKKYFGVLISGYGSTTYTSGKVTIEIVTEINRTERTYSKGFVVQ